MAIHSTRIEFEQRLPPVIDIKNQFQSITGLSLQIIASLNLVNLDSNILSVSSWLSEDLYKVKSKQDEEGQLEQLEVKEMFDYKRKHELDLIQDNFIVSLYLYVEGFYTIQFETGQNYIELTFLINQKYFVLALEKTLLKLGGKLSYASADNSNNYREKQLDNLKRWEDYKWYNRIRK